jgi:four helix bundle protein
MKEEKEYLFNEHDSSILEEGGVVYNIHKDFTSLDAWKKARLVKLFFYNEIISILPESEKYNLNIQIRKAAVSITANISEGYGRYNYQEGIQFYRISRASIYELKDHLISCFDFNYIDKNILNKGLELIEESKITLNGFINYVKSQKAKNEK